MKRKAFYSICLTMVFIAGSSFATNDEQPPQFEASTNLASIAVAEISTYAENTDGHWGETFDEIGYAPFEQHYYSFYLNSCDVVYPSEVTGYRGCPPELEAAFAECHKNMPRTIKEFCVHCNKKQLKKAAKGFCAAAVGNIDNDPKLDIWIVNPLKRPTNVQDDTVE